MGKGHISSVRPPWGRERGAEVGEVQPVQVSIGKGDRGRHLHVMCSPALGFPITYLRASINRANDNENKTKTEEPEDNGNTQNTHPPNITKAHQPLVHTQKKREES